MVNPKVIYLIASGASSIRCVSELIKEFARLDLPVYTILTENARNVMSPYNLADQEGHTLVESYFDPALINGREPGVTVVAPATFNTLNKISHGIADTLAHSLVAEAIGGGWPVIIAPSMNPALGNHPQVDQSLKTLQRWGVTVLEPQLEEDILMMASVPVIANAVERAVQNSMG